MTINYKILAQGAAENLFSELYTVPADKTALVKSINICNTASISGTVDIAIVDDLVLDTSPNYTLFGSDGYRKSLDGLNWTNAAPTPSFFSSNFYEEVVFLNGKYITTSQKNGNAGHVYVSEDGINWTDTNVYLNANGSPWFYRVKVANGKVFAFNPGQSASSGSIAYSTDGLTWTYTAVIPTPDSPITTYFHDIAYGEGKYLVGHSWDNSVNSFSVHSSTDLVTWQLHILPSVSRTPWQGNVFYTASGWTLGLKRNDNGALAAITSTDLVTWTEQVPLQNGSLGYGQQPLAYFNSKYFAPFGANKISVSTDLLSWQDCNVSLSTDFIERMPVLNGRLFAMPKYTNVYSPNSYYLAYTTDGVSWTRTDSNSGIFSDTGDHMGMSYGLPITIINPIIPQNQYILKNYEIAAGATIALKSAMNLDENKKIIVRGSKGIAISSFGGEL